MTHPQLKDLPDPYVEQEITMRPDQHSVNRHYVARLLLEYRIAEFRRPNHREDFKRLIGIKRPEVARG